MPPGSEGVVIVGISVTAILRFIMAFPAEFAALTVKLNVPDAVGIPVIAPVVSFKLRPVGNAPLVIVQVIGVVPVAASLWL